MMTREEEANEFWLLTQAILHDSKVDIEEARVIRRWLQEHQRDGEFETQLGKLDKFMQDRYIDRFESRDLITSIGSVLRSLRESAKAESAQRA